MGAPTGTVAFAFDIHESDRGDAIRLTLTGDLDMASAPMHENRLEELRARQRAVQLDLSRLEFMDSSGVHLLIQAFNSASADGWRFRVGAGGSRQVMRIIELKLERLLQENGPNWD